MSSKITKLLTLSLFLSLSSCATQIEKPPAAAFPIPIKLHIGR